jgi:ATP-binding cassette subfamily B protein
MRLPGAEAIRHAVASCAPAVAGGLVSTASSLPQVVFGIAVIGYDFTASASWIALVGGVALFVVSRAMTHGDARRVASAQEQSQRADAELSAQLGEKLALAEDLRLLGARELARSEFARAAEATNRAQDAFARALAASTAVRSAFSAVAPLIVILAVEIVQRGTHAPLAAGDVAKLVLLVPLLGARLDRLDAVREGQIQQAPLLDAVANVLALPAAPPAVPSPVMLQPTQVKGALGFEDVAFDYAGVPILKGTTFEIPAGAVVGLCGKNGCGKSTALRLLLRLADPHRGRVTIDGIDVRDVDPSCLPGLFAVLGQTSGLFQRTIRENLVLGNDVAPDETAIEGALTMAGVAHLFGRGGERGPEYVYRATPANLSGGETRRLLLARAFLRAGPILVLDEPEAALTSADAEAFLRAVVEARNGRTCLVVTHAPHLLPSTFNLVIHEGRVVDRGTHADLLERCSIYRDLHAKALQRAPDRKSA